MGILCIGDPHFKSDNGEMTEELTEKICRLLIERIDELDAVAIMGDILHRHEKVDLHPFYRAMSFLEKIHDILSQQKRDIFLYVLIGNHDRSNNQVFMTDEHVFNPLKRWRNTIVVDKAILHSINKDYSILLLPYVPPGRFEEAFTSVISVDKLKEGKTALVLAHQEFKGAKMNTITSNDGDPWSSLFPLCVSGHIHDYQRLSHNLIYTGTPIQHGFADSGRKTISLIHIMVGPDNRYGQSYEEERIDLKIKGKIQLKTSISGIKDLSLPLNDFFVKIKAEGKKSEIKTFLSSALYRDLLKKEVKFQFLELPSLPEGFDLDFPSKETKTNYSLSCRLREAIENSDEVIQKTYSDIFS